MFRTRFKDRIVHDTAADYSVRRGFTSQIIIDHVKSRDQVSIDNVGEALDRAVDNKVKNLVIQPTHLMNGLEYTDLVNEVAEYSDAFEKVAVGEPLLTTDDDFKAVIKAITEATAEYDDGETAICFMGHGTEAESNQVYSKMQDMLTDAGYKNYYVGTVEASPTVEDVLAAVQAGGYKKVVLEPLMIVAGDHANNDMAGDEEGSWKKTFEDAAVHNITCQYKETQGQQCEAAGALYSSGNDHVQALPIHHGIDNRAAQHAVGNGHAYDHKSKKT